MALKIVMFYRLGSSGFTETWYSQGTQVPIIMPAQDQAVCQQAQYFRSNLCTLTWVRYSVDQGNGPSMSFSPKAWGGQGSSGDWGVNQAPDVTSTTAVYRCYGQPGIRKRMFLRGLPDSYVTRDDTTGRDILPPQLDNYVGQYFRAAINAGWGIRVVNTTKNSNVVYNNVTNLSPGTTANSCLVTYGGGINPAYVLNSWVRFLKVPRDSIPGFPAIAKITVGQQPATPTFGITYFLRGGVQFNPTGMQVSQLAYTYQNFSNWEFERFSEHKTGRPFGLLRGRARSVVRAI